MKDKHSLITGHARERWQERFGEASLQAAFDRSIPYGAQMGKSMLKIDIETGAVFVVKRGVVKTVLTKEMAIANQQLTVVTTRGCDFSGPCVLDAIALEVKALASRHVEESGAHVYYGSVRLNGAYKPRLKEFRCIVPMDSRDYEKYLAIYYRAITEEGRKWLKKEGAK